MAAFQFGLDVGQHELGQFGVFIGRMVARAGDHFGALRGSAKLGYLLGSLIQQ